LFRVVQNLTIAAALLLAVTEGAKAQDNYVVAEVGDSGTISGTVKWSGPFPHLAPFPITKDPEICDPESHKKANLERLVIGPQGGVANTVVFLRNIVKGKPLQVPEIRRSLDQKHCRYEPHILLVPVRTALQMKSSDATLHTIHMDGAATYNLPFPFPNQVISREMTTSGLVNLRCNGGHVWMNAEMFIIPHPYYAVTDESGKFSLTDVPPGEYELVAWHEGWDQIGEESMVDVLTQRKVQRPLFKPPRTWQKSVSVSSNQVTQVDFVLSEK
jgi:hypothetical protein